MSIKQYQTKMRIIDEKKVVPHISGGGPNACFGCFSAGVTFIVNRGDYDAPEVVIEYYISPTSPNVIDELTIISPAIILADAGDMDSIQLSIPNILDNIPNLKVYRFNLSSDCISIFRSESLKISHVNE